MAGIIVYVLGKDGAFNKNSLGAISKASKLAGELGGVASAVVVGESFDDAKLAELGKYGAAKVFKVPTILTSVIAERGGFIFPQITDVFPGQEVIDRTFINTWEDQKVVDASGAVSVEAHQVAIQRMIAAGANMMTWLALAAEWQRDWARAETAGGLTEVLLQHAAGSGIAYLWEQQLLNTPAPTTAG